MDRRLTELGDFLRTRRARLAPAAHQVDGRRQVPGLRREELAALAGVSNAYYIRLEQGRAPNVSSDVLDALCRALGLDDAERAHAWRLARPGPPPATTTPVVEHVRPAIHRLVEAVMPTPALVLGRDRHLLAWNAMAHQLHAPHLPFALLADPAQRPWWPALLFEDPQVAALFVDYDDKARDTVADLRGALGRRPQDDALAALTEGLRSRNARFDALWRDHPITTCAHHYRHPEVGELELHDEFVGLGDDDGQRLALFTAAPGSPAAEALRRLADLAPKRPRDLVLDGGPSGLPGSRRA